MTILLLMSIGILLIVLNLRAIKKEKNSFHTVLDRAGNEMEEFLVEIGKVRREFAETLVEIQQDIVAIKEDIEEEKEKKLYIVNRIENKLEPLQEPKEIKNAEVDVINEKNIVEIKEKETNVEEKMYDNEVEVDFLKEVLIEKAENEFLEVGNNNSNRISEISRYLKEGISVDEVADKLQIGKGEVLLIRDLYLK